MLNLAVGQKVDLEGATCIQTEVGLSGHAVYGPYRTFAPGSYAVEFVLHAVEGQSFENDFICSTIDVVGDSGNETFARIDINLSRLKDGQALIGVPFQIKKDTILEFRVYSHGNVSLLIEEYRRVVEIEGDAADYASVLGKGRFPDIRNERNEFFLANRQEFRRLYEEGITFRIKNDYVLINVNGVWLQGREYDDIRFVDEIFFRNTYNFISNKPSCVIDVGMNVGLASLFFANKIFAQEIHSFEPFKETFDRALGNFELNPQLARKITTYNFGLAANDEQITVLLPEKSDSGANSIRGYQSGVPTTISVRNARNVLEPIIASALAKGLAIVAKIDCEGAEFSVFQELESGGLLDQISVFLVEWHRIWPEKTQYDLIRPLEQRGFVIFDLTTKSGNGFFYAVRSSPAS
jgi:FkbM family methyltransferase